MFGITTNSKNWKGALLLKLGFLIFGLTVAGGLLLGDLALAVTADITKVYKTDVQLTPGSIVALSGEKADYTVIAKEDDKQRVLGVVVDKNDSSVALETSISGANVALAGRALVNVLASENSIRRGDLISVSSVDGVGLKARPGKQTVGVAEASTKDLPADNGIKKLPIIVTPGVAEATITQGNVFARVAGKDVSAVQVFFAMAIAVCGIAAIGFLSYSSIRNSMMAVGRNPLARPAILSAMSQVMFMVSLIALVSVGLMYLTLRI